MVKFCLCSTLLRPSWLCFEFEFDFMFLPEFAFMLRPTRLYISTLCSTLCFDIVFDFMFRPTRLYVSTLCSTLCFDIVFDFMFRPTRLYVSTLSSTIAPSPLWIFGRTLTWLLCPDIRAVLLLNTWFYYVSYKPCVHSSWIVHHAKLRCIIKVLKNSLKDQL